MIKEYEMQDTKEPSPHSILIYDNFVDSSFSCMIYLFLCPIFITWFGPLLQFAFIFT